MGAAAVPCSEGGGKLLAPSSVGLEHLEPGPSTTPRSVALSQVPSCRVDEHFPFEALFSLGAGSGVVK